MRHCRVGEFVENNEVLVNKETPISKSAGVLDLSGAVKEFAPKPERWKGPLGGCDAFVDRVMLTSNSEDFFIIKVSGRLVLSYSCCCYV